MKVSILGGGGFLGARSRPVWPMTAGSAIGRLTGLTLFDLAAPPKPAAAFPVTAVAGDIVELPGAAIPPDTDVIFHLAAVVSAQAEADYDLGRRVNLRGTDAVIDACRRLVAAGRRPPRVVFTSSVATFCGGQNANLQDDARQVPANSYGAQKAAAELVLADASRRGFIDVVSLRLPTVIVRPGRPNRPPARSSRPSSASRCWGCRPNCRCRTISPPGCAARAARWTGCCTPQRWIPRRMGIDRSVNPAGISTTIAHMLQALDEVRPGASALVRRVEDKEIAAIVGVWPAAFEAMRARTLDFAMHEPLVEVIRAFVEDDLAATRAERALPA